MTTIDTVKPRKFRAGDRVEFRPDLVDLMRHGMPKPYERGTVATVAGFHGVSIYPDPLRSMLFVQWDSGVAVGVGLQSVVWVGVSNSK